MNDDTRIVICYFNIHPSIAIRLESLVRESGWRSVTALHWDDRNSNHWPADVDVLISVTLGDQHEYHMHLERWCRGRGLFWLRTILMPSSCSIDIGPVFSPSMSCYRCFSSLHLLSKTINGCTESYNVKPYEVMYFCGLVFAEICVILVGTSRTALPQICKRHVAGFGVTKELLCSRLPYCNFCRVPYATVDHRNYEEDTNPDETHVAIVFEDYLAETQRQRELTAVVNRHRLQEAMPPKRLNECPEIKLPRQPSRDRFYFRKKDRLIKNAEMGDLNNLSLALRLSAGYRNLDELGVGRWAASAGNLASAELYVINRTLRGLPSGKFFYQSDTHTLAHLTWPTDSLSSSALFDRIVGRNNLSPPCSLIVFTGAYHRLARKYGTFGYRLANLDGGVASRQFRSVIEDMGMSAQLLTSWPDNLLASALNLRDGANQVTALIAIWPCREGLGSQKIRFMPYTSSTINYTKCSTFFERSLQSVYADLYRQSRMDRVGLLEEQDDISHLGRTSEQSWSNSGIFLGSIPRFRDSAVPVIYKRKTTRSYSSSSINPGQLGTILHRAMLADYQDWPKHTALRFVIACNRVEGIAPGIYEYGCMTHSLRLLELQTFGGSWREMFIQQEFSAAAFAIFICGDLATETRLRGALGHRQLLLRAGSAANNLWLDALAFEMVGAIAAGIIARHTRTKLKLDGFEKTFLVAFVGGHAPETVSRPLS